MSGTLPGTFLSSDLTGWFSKCDPQTVAAASGSLFEVPILRPHSRPSESDGWGLLIWNLTSSPSDSDTCKHLRHLSNNADGDPREINLGDCDHTVTPCICGFCIWGWNHPWIENTQKKKNPESSEKQNLNLLCAGNYLHSFYTVFATIYIAFMSH